MLITLLVSLGDSLTTVYGLKKYGLDLETNPIWVWLLRKFPIATFVILHYGLLLVLVVLADLFLGTYMVYVLWCIGCLPILNNLYALYLYGTKKKDSVE